MKKSITFVAALFSSVSILLTGCSLPEKEVKEATEYLNDKGTAEASTTDEASAEKSIVVINDLFEPTLEDPTATAEASVEEKKEEEPAAETSDDRVTIVCFGDSQLANGRDEDTDIPKLLESKVPNAKVYNLAISGTTATLEQRTSDASPDNMHSTCFLGMAYCLAGKSDKNETLGNYPVILDKMESVVPEEVDYYVLSYGTNDFFSNAPLDIDSYASEGDQAHALYNALSKGIDVLQSVSPNAKFILMTPFYGIYVDDAGGYIGDSYIVSNGIGTLSDYAEKVKNVAENKHLTLFDGMFQTRCNLYLDTAGAYLMDNLHLNLTGRQIVARLLAHNVNYEEGNEPYAFIEMDRISISDFDPEVPYVWDENYMKEEYPSSWSKYIAGEFPLAQPSEEALAEYNGG